MKKEVEEQEVIFCMDRFGYAKTVDVSVYEAKQKKAADSENKYSCKLSESGKICLFTDPEKCIRSK